MVKKNKSIQKCVRMTQETYDFIMTFDGEGFNQKFEHACSMFGHELERLDVQIGARKRELERLDKSVYDTSALLSNLRRITDYVQYASDVVSRDMPTLFDKDDK